MNDHESSFIRRHRRSIMAWALVTGVIFVMELLGSCAIAGGLHRLTGQLLAIDFMMAPMGTAVCALCYYCLRWGLREIQSPSR